MSGCDHQRPGHLEQLALAARELAGEVVADVCEPEPGRAARRLCASIAFSCARHRGLRRLLNSFSPVCPVAPSFMFSSTDRRDSDFVSWNVRTIPSRATLYEGTPASERSPPLRRKVHCPTSLRSKPVNRLNSVVLPAPFGPIRAVMAPRWISRCSTSTATSPPKLRRTSSTTRIGSGFLAPGAGGTSASAAFAAAAFAFGAVDHRGVDEGLALLEESLGASPRPSRWIGETLARLVRRARGAGDGLSLGH